MSKGKGKKQKDENIKPEQNGSFGLDMDFDEALERFLKVRPNEIEDEKDSRKQRRSKP